MSREPDPIDFWFDFSSPYAYIASEWIEALAARHGRRVRWHAMLLGVAFQAASLKSPVDYPLKRECVLRDFGRSARFEGAPYRQPEPFPIPTQNAARIFWWLDAEDPERAAAWAHAGMRGYFVHGVALDDPAALRRLAEGAGLDADAAEAACAAPRWKNRLREVNDEAVAAGIFGAPYIVVDGEPFWGNDRKPQIERWLADGPF